MCKTHLFHIEIALRDFRSYVQYEHAVYRMMYMYIIYTTDSKHGLCFPTLIARRTSFLKRPFICYEFKLVRYFYFEENILLLWGRLIFPSRYHCTTGFLCPREYCFRLVCVCVCVCVGGWEGGWVRLLTFER